jgi:hypothetical protein
MTRARRQRAFRAAAAISFIADGKSYLPQALFPGRSGARYSKGARLKKSLNPYELSGAPIRGQRAAIAFADACHNAFRLDGREPQFYRFSRKREADAAATGRAS